MATGAYNRTPSGRVAKSSDPNVHTRVKAGHTKRRCSCRHMPSRTGARGWSKLISEPGRTLCPHAVEIAADATVSAEPQMRHYVKNDGWCHGIYATDTSA